MKLNNNGIRRNFHNHFDKLIRNDKKILHLFYEIFINGTAYVVGGYFRDFLNNKPSRDLDVIVEISSEELDKIIIKQKCKFTKNRHGGIKIQFDSINLDIWSIHNNWAFQNNLVKLNEKDKLNSIAKGCFYNYDSLVINLQNFSFNLQYYNQFRSSNQLDILQSRSIYKNLNPTTEANILRAFYLKRKYNSTFTLNTYQYLLKKVGSLNDQYDLGVVRRLIEIKKKYPKYKDLTEDVIVEYLSDLKYNDNPGNQFYLEL